MRVIDRATKHYERVRGETRMLEVPEWGDDDGPLKVYVRPANMHERDEVYKLVQKGTLGALVEAVIIRSRDEEGELMFKRADRQALMRNADPDVIARLANEMNDDLDTSDNQIEEVKGNSDVTPTSSPATT